VDLAMKLTTDSGQKGSADILDQMLLCIAASPISSEAKEKK